MAAAAAAPGTPRFSIMPRSELPSNAQLGRSLPRAAVLNLARQQGIVYKAGVPHDELVEQLALQAQQSGDSLSQEDMINKMKSNLLSAYPPPGMIFDGKRMRKAVSRKTVDYNSPVASWLQNRIWQRDQRDRRIHQPDYLYINDLLPPAAMLDKPISAVTTKFVRQSTNKIKCPIFVVCWNPDGRRLITGASSGEFTLWNGLSFNFETILQAHDSSVRAMTWSLSEKWLVSADSGGYIKYWQPNMNNVKMFQAHRESIRGLSFCPSDSKFATCSDDGTVRVFDFASCGEEQVLRGHGSDVKCVQWHPQKALIVSGSKDSQQPIKLWCPKSGQSLFTLYAHKNTCTDVRWNRNGNWLLTSSRDQSVKLFDIRNLKEDVQTFKGHKREATAIAWHPIYEGMFASSGGDGSIMFWQVGFEKELGGIDEAHDNYIWSLHWHPLGHILASGGNDHSTKFWTRSRPGDLAGEKFQTSLSLTIGGETTETVSLDSKSKRPSQQDDLLETLGRKREVISIPGLGGDVNKRSTPAGPRKPFPSSAPGQQLVPRDFEQMWQSKGPTMAGPPPGASMSQQNYPPSGYSMMEPSSLYQRQTLYRGPPGGPSSGGPQGSRGYGSWAPPANSHRAPMGMSGRPPMHHPPAGAQSSHDWSYRQMADIPEAAEDSRAPVSMSGSGPPRSDGLPPYHSRSMGSQQRYPPPNSSYGGLPHQPQFTNPYNRLQQSNTPSYSTSTGAQIYFSSASESSTSSAGNAYSGLYSSGGHSQTDRMGPPPPWEPVAKRSRTAYPSQQYGD